MENETTNVYEVYRLFCDEVETAKKKKPVFRTYPAKIKITEEEYSCADKHLPPGYYILRVKVRIRNCAETEELKAQDVVMEDYVIGDDQRGELCAYRLIYEHFGRSLVPITQLNAHSLEIEEERRIATITYEISKEKEE